MVQSHSVAKASTGQDATRFFSPDSLPVAPLIMSTCTSRRTWAYSYSSSTLPWAFWFNCCALTRAGHGRLVNSVIMWHQTTSFSVLFFL